MRRAAGTDLRADAAAPRRAYERQVAPRHAMFPEMADRWPVESRRRILVGVILARAALPYERWSSLVRRASRALEKVRGESRNNLVDSSG